MLEFQLLWLDHYDLRSRCSRLQILSGISRALSSIEFSRLCIYIYWANGLLELQLRGPATDPTDPLWILCSSYESFDPLAEARASAGRQQCYWNKDI
jgi:hypothetical protein